MDPATEAAKGEQNSEADALARDILAFILEREPQWLVVLCALARLLGQLSVEASTAKDSRLVLEGMCRHADMARRVKITAESLEAAGLGALNLGRR